jgi:hypothetical protein
MEEPIGGFNVWVSKWNTNVDITIMFNDGKTIKETFNKNVHLIKATYTPNVSFNITILKENVEDTLKISLKGEKENVSFSLGTNTITFTENEIEFVTLYIR